MRSALLVRPHPCTLVSQCDCSTVPIGRVDRLRPSAPAITGAYGFHLRLLILWELTPARRQAPFICTRLDERGGFRRARPAAPTLDSSMARSLRPPIPLDGQATSPRSLAIALDRWAVVGVRLIHIHSCAVRLFGPRHTTVLLDTAWTHRGQPLDTPRPAIRWSVRAFVPTLRPPCLLSSFGFQMVSITVNAGRC